MIRLARTNRSKLAEWWWTVDKWTLFGLFCLMMIGGVLTLAASPAVATRIHLPPFHFVYRQMIFLIPTIAVMIAVSVLNVRQVRRLAAIVYLGSLALMALALFIGPEVKGAHRWLQLGPLALQPSEFIKPAFIVLAAWMFAEAKRVRGFPGVVIAIVLYVLAAGVLVLQPDFGQLMLLTITFCGIFFVAGISWRLIATLVVLTVVGAVAAYSLMPHVASRVDRFMDPESGDTYQVDRAMEAFHTGGIFGRGPGEGEVKRILPDAHTDFIFAVAAEEYGVMAGLLIISVFGFVVLRNLSHARLEQDLFLQFATCGLVTLFGLQALINMMVNVHLIPAKGMTLPFISYGGSSMIAIGLTMGMLLALTRRRAGSQVTPPNGKRVVA